MVSHHTKRTWAATTLTKFNRNMWIGFFLYTGKHSLSFVLKSTQKIQVPLTTGTRDLWNSPPFNRLPCFHMAIIWDFEHFYYFNFDTSFLGKKLFWKTEVLFFVERTMMEKAPFPYKTALSKANVKTNWTNSKRWTYHKEVLPINKS